MAKLTNILPLPLSWPEARRVRLSPQELSMLVGRDVSTLSASRRLELKRMYFGRCPECGGKRATSKTYCDRHLYTTNRDRQTYYQRHERRS